MMDESCHLVNPRSIATFAPLAPLQSDRKFTFLHSSSNKATVVVLEQDETFLTRRIEALSVSPKESYIQSFGQITELESQRKKVKSAAAQLLYSCCKIAKIVMVPFL